MLIGCIVAWACLTVLGLHRIGRTQAAPPPTAVIAPELAAALAEAAPEQLIPALVLLRDTADLNSLPTERAARPPAVRDRLQATAQRAQAPLLEDLARAQRAGRVASMRPFWIVNAVAVVATADLLAELAHSPAVARLESDVLRRWLPEHAPMAVVAPTSAAAATAPVAWGVAQVRAPEVWHGLGVTGSGVVVANMDSGVNWQHPDLRPTYRGLQPDGRVQHAGNWFDATEEASAEPVDPDGHGTHVMGSIVGQNGIGVAPGARWIAVRVFDANGQATLSGILSGFEWLLAPEGDPQLAPDIVNHSWGAPGYYTPLWPAVEALRAAGIVAVFAAGNAGPAEETIDAPASYTGTLAVGAGDDAWQPAWFSARGPSPLPNVTEAKPTLLAPGTAVVSAYAPGGYARANGTSMAAPHVAGALALLRSADPQLDEAALMRVLTETARPPDGPRPNLESGWGYLDAYAAVGSRAQAGRLTGRVLRAIDGAPLSAVRVSIATPAGATITTTTDAAGAFAAYLRGGFYDVRAEAFGYDPGAQTGVVVVDGQATAVALALTAQPVGRLTGQIVASESGEPISATVRVRGAPVATQADAQGVYTLTLPVGAHVVEARHIGRRTVAAAVSVTSAGVEQSFQLAPVPRILLVDGGRWIYDSQIGYYRQALDALEFGYDEWRVTNPIDGAPSRQHLSAYDVVIWSDPRSAPGRAGAGNALYHYLRGGGRLLVSGQYVGAYDGTGWLAQRWWYEQLRARYLGETTPQQGVRGALDQPLFRDLSLQFNGPEGAANQQVIGRAEPLPGSLTEPLLLHPDGRAAALGAGWCERYRIVYLGFGLEGVTGHAARREVLARSLAYLTAPPRTGPVALSVPFTEEFGPPGRPVTFTISARNLDEGLTRTVRFTAVGSQSWPIAQGELTRTFPPCGRYQENTVVTPPPDTPPGVVNVITFTATLTDGASTTLILRPKTPGHVLFVDDDRWYNREGAYLDALAALDIPVDYWEVGWDNNVRGRIPSELLTAYDVVIWYTGNDWYQPLDQTEIGRLLAYMQQGGRLLLASQDYLYYHAAHPLTGYLGVQAHVESITPTLLFGSYDRRPGALGGPYRLTMAGYDNSGDGLLPRPNSRAIAWQQGGYPAALATAGPDWRTVFWGAPPETLPPEGMATAVNEAIGWLSDLADSTFEVAPRAGPAELPRAYTLTVRALPTADSAPARVSVALPDALALQPDTLQGATPTPDGRRLVWEGVLGAGEAHTITWQAQFTAEMLPATTAETVARLHGGRARLTFDQTAVVWTEAPDLTPSRLTVTGTQPGFPVTYTLALRNAGSAGPAAAWLYWPVQLEPLTQTLAVSWGSARLLGDNRLYWMGELPAGGAAEVSLALATPATAADLPLAGVLRLEDGSGLPLTRDATLILPPPRLYLPWLVVTAR